MAKRGCSCWPFFRATHSSKTPAKESQKTTNLSKSVSRAPESAQISFMNGNFHMIQRNQAQIPSEQSDQNRARTTEVLQRGNGAQYYQALMAASSPQPIQSRFEEIRNRNKVRIKTNISKSDVKYMDNYPLLTEEQRLYKYSCPICLRYFNTILISSCCQNYLCRLCIGDMAKKAKRDNQFVIKCPQCSEVDFKLEDVKPEDKVKYYTDTPFKNTKTNHHNENTTPCQQSPNQPSHFKPQKSTPQQENSAQPSGQIISPSFQIHLTEASQNAGRSSNLNNFILQNDNNGHALNLLIPEGDNENPYYESPFPLARDSPALQEEEKQPNLPQPLEESKVEIKSADKYEFQGNRQLSVKSIPLFKNDGLSFMDAVQLQNCDSKRLFKSENLEMTVRMSLDNEQLFQRRSLNSIYYKQNTNFNQPEILERIRANKSLQKRPFNFRHEGVKEQIDSDYGVNFRMKRDNSLSNHSNKSEEQKSTIKKNVQQFDLFAVDNLSPDDVRLNNNDQSNVGRRSIVPIRDILRQRSILSEIKQKVVNESRLQSTTKKTSKKKRSDFIKDSQFIIKPHSLKTEEFQIKLREKLRGIKQVKPQIDKENIDVNVQN